MEGLRDSRSHNKVFIFAYICKCKKAHIDQFLAIENEISIILKFSSNPDKFGVLWPPRMRERGPLSPLPPPSPPFLGKLVTSSFSALCLKSILTLPLSAVPLSLELSTLSELIYYFYFVLKEAKLLEVEAIFFQKRPISLFSTFYSLFSCKWSVLLQFLVVFKNSVIVF